MSEKASALLDPYRLAQSRRGLSGTSKIADFPRLQGLLAHSAGEVRWTLDFGVDSITAPYCDVTIEGTMGLQCQRSLKGFEFEVNVSTRLALVNADDDGTESRHEPLVVEADGLYALDIVEDELILAVPLVPVSPDSEPVDAPPIVLAQQAESLSPFAVLKNLKSPT